MKKEFKKSDLKTGDQIEKRNGLRYVVMLGTPRGDVYVAVNGIEWGRLSYYNEKMEYPNDIKGYDIVAVYSNESPNQYLKTKMDETCKIWQREKVPEYTMEEAIEKMGHEFKIKK